MKTDPFPFRRGSNMGLWLSQANVLDEQHLTSFYRREHIARLAQAGADHLRLPVDCELTHQKAPWCEWLKTLDLTVEYPSQLPDLAPRQADLRDPASREQLMLFSAANLGYERMEHLFEPVAAFARRTGAPIYCTEFGCWDPAPPVSQLNWFRDSVRLFANHGVAWAQWEYSNLFQRDGRPKPPLAVLFEEKPCT